MRRIFLLLLWLSAPAFTENLNSQAEALVRASDVVFLGESHRNESDHRRQLYFLKDIAELDDRPLIILAEMFTSRADEDLDTWNQTSEFSDFPSPLWKREWGHPYSLYQPIWRWAHKRSISVMSLRPDPALTKTLKKDGPSAVVDTIGEVLIGPRSYRQHMAKIVAMHYPPEQTPEEKMINQFFTVQCFWDEFMAWRVSQISQQYPEHRIAVLVGHGHLHPGHGIGWRLGRRRSELKSLNVLFDEKQKDIAELLYLGSMPGE